MAASARRLARAARNASCWRSSVVLRARQRAHALGVALYAREHGGEVATPSSSVVAWAAFAFLLSGGSAAASELFGAARAA